MIEEKIIRLLRTHEGYISGEEMSHKLHLSRAAVWKYVQDLRGKGYDIEAVPHLGYRLLSAPDRLFPYEIQHGLRTGYLGGKIYYYEVISSTMDEAFALGRKGCPEGTVVCAESQTKGRGRLGRSWHSPKSKGVYMSIVLRPALSPWEVPKLTLLTAVALVEAIHKSTGLSPSIKWPNDLQIKGKKVAGILTELWAEADRVGFLVVGIGLNVNTPLSMLPPEGTSLKKEVGRPVSRVVVTRHILESLEEWYERIKGEGFLPVAQRWRELSATLHRWVKIVEHNEVIEGEAVDIDEDGGLLIKQDGRKIIKKMAGDVVILRE